MVDDDELDYDQPQQPSQSAVEPIPRTEKARQELHRRRVQQFWTEILSDEIGQSEIWKFLTITCHVYDANFGVGPNGSPQGEASFFNFGVQSVGNAFLRSLIAYDPKGVVAMHEKFDTIGRALVNDRRKNPNAAD